MKAAGWFTKFETLVAPQDGGNIADRTIPGTHGTSGPVLVSSGNWEYGVDKTLLAAIPQVPGIKFSELNLVRFPIVSGSMTLIDRQRRQRWKSTRARLRIVGSWRRCSCISLDRTFLDVELSRVSLR